MYASGQLAAISSIASGVANARDDVLALRVDEKLSVELLLTGRRIACEGDAGARVVAKISEHHGHDVDRRAEVFRNGVHLSVVARLFQRPRLPDRFDRAP